VGSNNASRYTLLAGILCWQLEDSGPHCCSTAPRSHGQSPGRPVGLPGAPSGTAGLPLRARGGQIADQHRRLVRKPPVVVADHAPVTARRAGYAAVKEVPSTRTRWAATGYTALAITAPAGSPQPRATPARRARSGARTAYPLAVWCSPGQAKACPYRRRLLARFPPPRFRIDHMKTPSP
jgi:hypothetical protein